METEAWDHTAYYPGAQQLRIHVTGDGRSGQLLGHSQSELAKHIDVYAATLFAGQSVERLGNPRPAVQLAARAWTATRNKGQS
ncbi:MAG: hypothetical protein JO352_25615 [Chloroflexi bacterium]|nr:hypothetical protein [Chloroflexota bacterium]MBV9596913.1 hypothetical protein [Chloroflexota bacterium]